jgi:hypothetical protein
VAVVQGNLPEAQRLFAESIRIAQRLTESDLGNAVWQRELWVSHYRIADLLEKQADAKAIDHWRKAHDILANMIRQSLHVSPQDREFLQQLRAKLDSSE